MDSVKKGIQYLHHFSSNRDIITPQLSTRFVAFLSVLYTVVYVLPFYLFAASRPSSTVSRESPTIIRTRIRLVSTACIVCSLTTVFVLVREARLSRAEVFHLLGWYPVRGMDILKTLSLTMLLFLGPLFEKTIIDGDWRRYITGKPMRETLSSWTGWRNLVAGPITEEVLFRSLLTSLALLAPYSTKKTILITPLYFGVAHIHHFYESRLTNPRVPVMNTILLSLFQFTYTTLFGWYANFVFVRTGSLYAIILIHSFCNWIGFPRLWGRVEPEVVFAPGNPPSFTDPTKGPAYRPPFPQPPSPSVLWTVTYYVLLVAGAVVFWLNLWPLTASTNRLALI